MKRIAYTHREFRLCEWPYLCRGLVYAESIASAMENGVAFADQERVKYQVWQVINGNPKSWQPKDGDNWPAPQEAEIIEISETQVSQFDLQAGRVPMGTTISINRKVAVLKSESVEKKESKWNVIWDSIHIPGITNGEVTLRPDEYNRSEKCKERLQSIADRLNQGRGERKEIWRND